MGFCICPSITVAVSARPRFSPLSVLLPVSAHSRNPNTLIDMQLFMPLAYKTAPHAIKSYVRVRSGMINSRSELTLVDKHRAPARDCLAPTHRKKEIDVISESVFFFLSKIAFSSILSMYIRTCAWQRFHACKSQGNCARPPPPPPFFLPSSICTV